MSKLALPLTFCNWLGSAGAAHVFPGVVQAPAGFAPSSDGDPEVNSTHSATSLLKFGLKDRSLLSLHDGFASLFFVLTGNDLIL